MPNEASVRSEDSKIHSRPPVETETTLQRICRDELQSSIYSAVDATISYQNTDGHWRYDLECFTFPPAFHIITLSYIGHTIEPELKTKFGNYLRRSQLPSRGWGFFPNGEIVLSNSVVTYFALRLLGDKQDEEHMLLARKAILNHGGIEASNFKTRFNLALFGIVPWSCIPCMPVEIILLPKWFPFNLYKLSYWARTPLVPMMVLQAINRLARNPSLVELDELFIRKPSKIPFISREAHQNLFLFHTFSLNDKILKLVTGFLPNGRRHKAISAALSFCTERLNGLDGFGSISPAMNYLLMMFDAMGYDENHPDRVIAKRAHDTFVEVRHEEAFTVACFSPVWDTALTVGTLLETESKLAKEAAGRGLEWLRPLQILDVKGDWSQARPNIRPGEWAFSLKNPYFPDTDDTAVVMSAMHKLDSTKYMDAISRGTECNLGMEAGRAFRVVHDADNCHTYLNSVPAADRGSFVDPPTVDVTGSCLKYLAEAGYRKETFELMRRAVKFVLGNQEPNRSWWGLWGVNFIYGTWMALCSITAAGLPLDHPSVVQGTQWLISIQNEDGGWGEGIDSYNAGEYRRSKSTCSQTAWAVLGLMAGLAQDHPAITSDIQYLLNTQNEQGLWEEEEYTGTGHPNIIYLKYHGYPKHFPLLALARYSKLKDV